MSEPHFRGTMLLLQNRTKRDPESYREEFLSQLAHFNAHSKAMASSTKQHSNQQYLAVLGYICNVSHCFARDCAHVPQVIIDTLRTGKGSLDPETRLALVKNLILLRSRGIVQPDQTLPVFFELLLLRDKALRKLILAHIVGDIKRINLPGAKNGAAVNKKVQNFLFGVMKEDDPIQAYCALLVVIDLYRRQIWTDERAVEVIAEACFSRHTKTLRVALRFFMMQMPRVLSMESDDDADDADDPGRVISKMKQKLKVKAKTRKRERVLEREKGKAIRRYDKEAKAEEEFARQTADPLRFLRDPQAFCERLFQKLQKTSERFEVRILYLHVIARVINEHEVVLLSLYPYLERYMEPTQLHATQLLALAASCVHRMIPPDAVEPLIRTVANHFVNDRSDPDSITIGINTIREMCKRQPLAMARPLLADLCEYKSHRGQRGVIMAARALIQLYRTVAPDLLPSKLRGGKNAPTGANSDDLRFGAAAPLKDIPGMELLMEHLGEAPPNPEDLDDGSDNGDVDAALSSSRSSGASSSSSSDSGSWIDVSHSDDSDADDDLLSDEAEESGEEDEGESDDECPALVPAEPASRASRSIVSPFTGKVHQVVMPDDDEDVWVDDDGGGSDGVSNKRTRKAVATKESGRAGCGVATKSARPDGVTQSASDSDGDESGWSEWEETDDEEEDSDEEEEEEAEEEAARAEEGGAPLSSDDSDVEEGEWDGASEEGSANEEEEEDEEASAAEEEEEASADDGAFFEDAVAEASRPKAPSAAPSSVATTTLSATRLLTDADFAKMRHLMAARGVGVKQDHRSLRGKQKDEAERRQKRHQLIHGVTADLQPSMLETFTNRKREVDKEEKIAQAVEKRAEKQPFNARKKSKAKLYSTNVEKAKRGKLFQMTKRSQRVADKIKRSTVERGDRKKDMKKKDVKFRIRRGWKA